MTDETAACPHPAFAARVDVIWMPDVAARSADVTIRCQACDEPFTFIGVEAGLSSHGPRVSVDGTELHVPIAPFSARLAPVHRWGFEIGPAKLDRGDASGMHETDPDLTQPSPAPADATDRDRLS